MTGVQPTGARLARVALRRLKSHDQTTAPSAVATRRIPPTHAIRGLKPTATIKHRYAMQGSVG